ADELVASPHADPSESHHFATVAFTPREGSVPVFDWHVVISEQPIVTDEDFLRATAANRAELDTVALELCSADEASFDRLCPESDAPLAFDVGQLSFLTTYHVAVRAEDYCGRLGPIASAQLTTT